MSYYYNAPSSDVTNPLWENYHANRSIAARNALVVIYKQLPECVASGMIGKLPESVEIDDLISAGTIGLMQAVEKFDPARGINFKTFACNRIRGAILDELRNIDHVARKVRERYKQLHRAKELLHTELGREPTQDELIAELNVTPKEFAWIVRDEAKAQDVTSLSTVTAERDIGTIVTLGDSVAAPDWSDPTRNAERNDLIGFVLRTLPNRWSMFISFHYLQGETMESIGQRLGKSGSRVSQLTTHAIDLARDACLREAA